MPKRIPAAGVATKTDRRGRSAGRGATGRVSRWLLGVVAAAVLAGCTPGVGPVPGAGPLGARVIDRAVDTAVDRAVDTVVGTVVNRLVSRAVDMILDRIFDRVFGEAFGDGELRFGEDFVLDVLDGRYQLVVEGDGPLSGVFRGEPSAAGADPETVNASFGLRGQDEDGVAFVAATLLHQETDPPFGFFLAATEEDGEEVVLAVLTIGREGAQETYEGLASWTLTTDAASRLAGSFEADELVSETGDGTVRVRGSFDLPINRAGSLTVVRR